MNTHRTTPPRPLDVTALFPQLAPLARTATRLHPRPGAPTVHDSSVGGPLLWPADEPWPYCEGPHELDGVNPAMSLADVRAERRIRAAAQGRGLTPQEKETLARIRPLRTYPIRRSPGRPPHVGAMAMLPLAQLYVRDVPDLRAPAGTDLLQVLWCPFDHPPRQFMPRTALFWRSGAAVTDILAAPPEPSSVQFDTYVPEPCLLDPEQITEYPHPLELTKELRDPLRDWSRWQTAGAAVDSRYASYPEEFYATDLSVAPGWKVGGWASWGYTDPIPQYCPACDTKMDPLLTVPTYEWDAATRGWIPVEEGEDRASATPPSTHAGPQTQAVIDFFRAKGIEVHDRGRVRLNARAATPPLDDRPPRQPTAVQIASGHRQQLYVCPTAPEHPHTELMQ
ncbi:hypothetical protein ACIP2X_06280 [Streptomyces sp. NPDC089424]|uniref:hypothetical protein n=1 Tax=Streptomyces sp. NPDC089424 TaxID=3365917 RepID=UPI0037F67D0C